MMRITTDQPQHQCEAAAPSHDATVFVAMELSASQWLVATNIPGSKEETGMESWVVDPASIAVDRRKRRAKTDRIDVEKLLQTLMAWARGERLVCSMVRPPTVAQEDARRLSRERERLRKERDQHVVRVKSLLALHGVAG